MSHAIELFPKFQFDRLNLNFEQDQRFIGQISESDQKVQRDSVGKINV